MDLQLDLFDQLSLEKAEDNRYLAIKEESYFHIGELLYLIISKVKEHKSIEKVQQAIAEEQDLQLDTDQINSIIEDSIEKLSLNPGEGEKADMFDKRSGYIFLKCELIKEGFLQKIASPLVPLFKRALFIPIMTVAFISSLYYFFVTSTSSSGAVLGWVEMGFVYLVLGLVFMAHELGHAVACKKYGIAPKSIGFGFYLIFPVFYTDVSRAWSLGKYKRIVINLGGIYFQAMINVVLIALYFMLGANEYMQSFVKIILVTNTFVAIYSLVPFLRYDGYWVYSDLFEIPNLMRRSLTYPFTLFREGLKEWNWALTFYSLMNYGTFYYLISQSVKGIEAGVAAGEIVSIFAEGGGLSVSGLVFWVKVFFLMMLFCFMIWNMARAGKNFLKNI